MRIEHKLDACIYLFIYWVFTSIGNLPISLFAKGCYTTMTFASLMFMTYVANSGKFGE